MSGHSLPDGGLDEILAASWQLLTRGAADQTSGFHTLTAATIGLDGRPRARAIVLRASNPPSRILRFHCDRRTDKFAELTADPRIALQGYDAETGIRRP